MRTVALLALLCCLVGSGECARVLGLFHYPGRSHFNMLEALMRGLAARGHEVTVAGHFPLADPPANYTDVSLLGATPSFVDSLRVADFELLLRHDGFSALPILYRFAEYVYHLDLNKCQASYEFPAMQKLIKSIRSGERRFDLVVTHAMFADCFEPVAGLLGVPLVTVSTSALASWVADKAAVPRNPSYIRDYYSSFSADGMGYRERLLNAITSIGIRWSRRFIIEEATVALQRRHLGSQLVSPAPSLVLVNTHHSLNGARPLPPNVVEVGGLHITKPPPLPQNLQRFLSGAEHGAIYFTFGSMIAVHKMPLHLLHTILEAFSRLPQRVLFKCDATSLPPSVTLPNNSMAVKWLPQRAVLAHPNVVAFLTHGGLLSMQEAVSSGVPMVSVPMVVDQKLNVDLVVQKGVAIKVDYQDLTADSLEAALRELIENPGYRKRAKELSVMFHDRPRPALEEALYWMEYVVRHRGAPHMRSAALDLPWYQYLLLDVIALPLAVVALTAALLFYVSRLVWASVLGIRIKIKTN